MEDAVAVHVVKCLEQLVHVLLYLFFRKVMSPTLDCLIQIHIHELKDQCEPSSWLIVKNFMELDDIWVPSQSSQSLNLSQVVHLVDAVKVIFHALDSGVLARFDRLGFQHL